ncbi:MAG: mycothiol conjugate amidase Mca [Actinobacteria bacterium]|nr:mycothiol conjugate amidase Mca [Actinomycetota bacterium]MBV9664669.1 mycothiol conjugate amidase Mca [Actinomycetota bacterium]
MDERLCLLCVHAHPDDEASKGAGTVAKYHAEGVHTVLVCATGGEEGDILNPAMDKPEVRENIHEIRLEELRRSVEVIGYDELIMLGYRDSGMPDSEANKDPRSFAQADLDEAVGRLVEIVRRTRPQVMITYNEDQQGYPHPDHLRVHDISMAAFEAAADPDRFPDAGEPWQISKVYYSVWSRKRFVAMHEKFLELGLESPFDDKWFDRPSQDDSITTTIDISEQADVRRNALLAHATQIDPTSPFWFGLPPDIARTVHPFEEYLLARSLVPTETPEDDLFAGVRERVSR